MSVTKQQALRYHAKWRPGKLEVVPSKSVSTQVELEMAYAPGVAEPVKEIAADPDKVFDYTTRGNLVAVISDGSAVLGLGNIGPLACKPVMEGKGMLFKRFAGIDVFDIELDTQNLELFVQTVRVLGPTFGGINLEDIKAPECFEIEERLKASMDIPVFHDDQHGTAIIAGSALLNALELVNKNIEEVKVVFSGAGAAGFACAKYFVSLGVKKENLILTDIKGVVYKGRGDNNYLDELAADTPRRTLAEAMEGADIFMGVSAAGVLKPEMLLTMNENPIVFAMANPVPEIEYQVAVDTRPDVIMATGRSDYPNQINNVLGFPFIFRGALDVRATEINEEMKIAATKALADLAKEDVPDDVLQAYGATRLQFGREYIIPKPFDSRVLYRVASAVAEAAMESGVARRPIADMDVYRAELEKRVHPTREAVRRFMMQARSGERARIVFPEGDHDKILRAAQVIVDEGIAHPILLGHPDEIQSKMQELGLQMAPTSYTIVNPFDRANIPERYVDTYTEVRERRGVPRDRAVQKLQGRIHYAMMMVREGDADGCVSGVSYTYPETIRPALRIVGLAEDATCACGMYMVLDRNGKVRFFADTTINMQTDADTLAQIAVLTADRVKQLGITPRVAMLSFSNFGSARNEESAKVEKATTLVKEMRPDLMIDGEMRVDVALDPERAKEDYPFCELKEEANVFIFPSLDAGNISYQMMQYLGGMEVVGPILIGLAHPVNVLPRNCSLRTVIGMTAVTAVISKRISQS